MASVVAVNPLLRVAPLFRIRHPTSSSAVLLPIERISTTALACMRRSSAGILQGASVQIIDLKVFYKSEDATQSVAVCRAPAAPSVLLPDLQLDPPARVDFVPQAGLYKRS